MELRKIILAVVIVFSINSLWAQKKTIKVQIMHEGAIVLDTTLYKTSDEAKVIIENLVQQFSTDPVTIDSKITHGLYVFNVENESWKGQKAKKQQNTTNKADKETTKGSTMNDEIEELEGFALSEENENNDTYFEDSLFQEFSNELDLKWNEMHIDVVIDDYGRAFDNLWKDIKSMDFEDNPDIQQVKKDFTELFNEIKATQFIIIHNSDTLDVK